jgi:glc operon protein GlcG
MKTKSAIKLTLDGAMMILQGALAKAKDLGAAASVTVVDDGGHMFAFGRSDEAELYSISIATAKARSAALTRFPSGKKSPSGTERDDHHALAITLAAGPGSFVTIPGGLPIFVDGHCIGAVAASGASKNDVTIAKAGIDAFEKA